jgi:signal transduction histidine kinase
MPRLIQSLATFAACCVAAVQAMADGGRLDAGLDEGAGELRARLPQVGELRATWSATIDDGTRQWRLDSTAAHEHFSPEMRSADGKSTAHMLFPGAQAELLLEMRIDAGMALCARVGVRNPGGRPFKFVSAHPIQARIRATGSGWALTGLHARTPVTAEAPGAEPRRIHEHGTLYRPDGTGFVFGPVGVPVSYADFAWARLDDGVFTMDASVSMDGVRVDPGETRWAQEIALVVGKPKDALASWADAVARSHHARKPVGALNGWNNWNQLARKDINIELTDILRTVRESDGRLRPAVVQMDYNYYDFDLTKSLASEWLPQRRQEIAAIGARFGAHVGFSGPGWPGLRDIPDLTATVSRAVDAGISYFKLFYPPGSTVSDGRRTAFEIYRDNWSAIRQAAGDHTYLLFCAYEPDRAAIGFVDASRVGPDAERGKIRAAIPATLRAFPLHDRWFTMDGDTCFTGTDIANISQVDGSWPLVRTWLSMIGLSCGSAITSDPWYWEDFKPLWRNVEILTPPARERTEVMDLGTDQEWPRLLGKVRREWGNSAIALLWNPGQTERTVTLDFARAGMDPQARHAVWSFWDDRYLGVAHGSWTTPRLGPSASQHLVFTALPDKPSKPVMIGSNLHIYCGAAEIKQVRSTRSSFSVEFTDAGAREGAIYLYSQMQPVLAKAAGCTVSGITSAGENVWRVNLHERSVGQPQRIDLKIPLPTTRQPWFWALIASVFISLLFSLWHFISSLRHERARALDQERARIARDIHDDLGASLTHIALLGELAQNEIDRPERARAHVDDIFRSARKLTRSVDEIVWALNPSNDTIARFAAYVGDFAQDFLQSADIDCRLAIPADLPDRLLPPKTRHSLFLVIKEALHNIVSHAQATCVHLRISPDGGLLRISILDNGRGFDPQAPAPSRPGGGHGLANLRQRIDEVGGMLDIRSAPGQGAEVIIEIKA